MTNIHRHLGKTEEQITYYLLAGDDNVLYTPALGIAAEFSKVEDVIDGFNQRSATSLHRLKEGYLVRIEGCICE